jgi:hypothetical protein
MWTGGGWCAPRRGSRTITGVSGTCGRTSSTREGSG